MRHTFHIALAVTTILAASGQALSAQSSAPRQPSVTLETATNLPFTLRSPSEVGRERLDRADQLMAQGKFSAAAREYAAVARMQQDANEIPGEALWKLAGIQHGRKNFLGAAGTLAELARIAELYGDPTLQAQALLEAAILYHRVGRADRARSCMERLEPLLHSPAISQEVRSSLQKRIVS